MCADRRPDPLSAAHQRALDEFLSHVPVATEVGALFAAAGIDVALVGGPVRDALLGTADPTSHDLDFTTSARPDRILAIVRPWADAVWETGRAYGTIGARKGTATCEITTYRADAYDETSRKPVVQFGDSLEDDLRRRDFTVNAMAVRLPGRTFVDPYEGRRDLSRGLLATPGPPEVSFSDDPLRMMRAARFTSQLGFEVVPSVVQAITAMTGRLAIVSAERVRDELTKLVLSRDPRRGLTLLVDTQLAELVLPELPRLRLEIDEHHRHKDVYEHTLIVLEQAIELERAAGWDPDLVLRLAALMHDVGKPKTRRFERGGGVSFHHHEIVGAQLTRARLQVLKFPKDVVEDVSKLVELHLRFHGYADSAWTDSAVRRYVRDAGPLLPRLHRLTRADCTTRNQRKADRLRRAYDALEARIEELREQEQLDAIRPDLDGNAIMRILDIPPGPLVGRAYRYLLELRLDRGPMTEDEAGQELHAWWAENG